MRHQYAKLKVSLLAACTALASTAPAFATEPVMISRLARDSGLAPHEVVLVLGDNIGLVEAQYYARPSMRGHLARLTREAHDLRIAARLPPPRTAPAFAELTHPDR